MTDNSGASNRTKRLRAFQSIIKLPRRAKRLVMVGLDLVILPAALWLAFSLRLGDLTPDVQRLWWMFPAVAVISVPIFARLGLYRAVIRFMGPQAMASVVQAVTLSALVFGVTTLLAGHNLGFPRSVLILYWLIALLAVGGSRFLIRAVLHGVERGWQLPGEPVVIYGAGGGGARLAAALQGGPAYRPIAFVDDDSGLWGRLVLGIKVYSPAQLPDLIAATGVEQVLMAVPSATPKQRQAILAKLSGLPVRVRTVPSMADIISGRAKPDEIREIDITDLLGRSQVAPDESLLRACVQGKSVLVTGAGGSIGSELCRQLLRLSPQRLILLEQSEYGLYQIERELSPLVTQLPSPPQIVPLLGDVNNRARMEQIMRGFGVATVYHAAAYKHVPIVEYNVTEGVRNNVFGARVAAEAARAAGVATFVLISTDKAVRPTNIMGASKRMAELVLQGLAEQGGPTTFCMVRFGNVLGSSGSVVPLFREQIAKGGPVSVTHPEVTRYFMTIPEAAALVIQASAMARGGDVFVLDMGEPVRIADLARKMIQLSGYTVRDERHPEGDIEIQYTGLRPGEKLYEELLIGDNVTGTQHPMILRAMESSIPWDRFRPLLDQLEAAVAADDCRAVQRILVDAVHGYIAGEDLHDLVWNQRRALQQTSGKITRLRP